MRVTVVVGNPKPRSRTYEAARLVARELVGREPDAAFDLAEFGPRLLDWSDADVADAVASTQNSDLAVIASPTYKGSYTGLLKLYLDRFGAGTLSRTRVVPLMLGGHWKHALAPEVHLKPVLAELGASMPTAALFLLDSEWDVPDALAPWLTIARQQLGLAS